MSRATKFQSGDTVTINILKANLASRWGRYQHKSGKVLGRKESGTEILYQVEIEGREVWIPSQLLYPKGTTLTPTYTREQLRIANALRRLKPGATIVLSEYNCALPYDSAAEAVWPGTYPLEGAIATLLKRKGYSNVIQVRGLPGLWVIPTISTNIITDVI